MRSQQVQESPQRLVMRETADDSLIEVELSGKLTREDYERFVPEIERKIAEQGKLRLLVIMHDFHGWRLAALWQDIKFDLRHFKHFERIALVGENKWQEWMSAICLPFATGELRFFHQDQLVAAREWVNVR